jgi:universal stress protein A
MAVYQRILLAVDLTEESEYLGERARELASALGAHLELLHVVEPVPPVVMAGPEPVPIALPTTDELIDTARAAMQKLAEELRIAEAHSSIEVGTTRTEIIRVARARKMDLIMMGAHERHALAFLFKPTEDVVLHRAPCDVLAIRIPHDDDSKK